MDPGDVLRWVPPEDGGGPACRNLQPLDVQSGRMYSMYMKHGDVYGIRDLQRHLSQALRSVREGRRVVVTDDGRPVAVILSSSEALPRQETVERKLVRLLRQGKVVQLGRVGSSRRLRAWKLGRDWTRGFLEHRR